MSTGVYKLAEKAFVDGDIDLLNDVIRAALVDITGYTVDLSADQFLTDISPALVVSSVVLTGKSTGAKGEFRADDCTFPSVPAGNTVGAIMLWQDTGLDSTSRLIYYSDDSTGLPVDPVGDDMVIAWPSPIFSLSP